MYRRDREQIVALRLPNMGLKVSLGSSRLCHVFGVVVRPEKFQFLEKWQNSNFGQKSEIYSLDLG